MYSREIQMLSLAADRVLDCSPRCCGWAKARSKCSRAICIRTAGIFWQNCVGVSDDRLRVLQ